MDDLLKLLSSLDQEKAKLDRLLPLSSSQQKVLDQKLRLEWNYHSNHIEGSTLSYGQTKLLLFFDQTSGDHPLRDIEEMKAHDTAVAFVKQEAIDPDRKLTAQFLRELNEIILVRPFYKEAITHDGQDTRKLITTGQYKTSPNSVRLTNGELFEYASPEETPILVSELIGNFQNKWQELHPIIQAASFHYRFVRIHPFDDGNGRVARLIMNYILLQNGYPPIIIRTEDKKNYLLALRRADTGDLDAFIRYIANQLPYTFDFYFRAAKGESLDDLGDFEKKLALIQRRLSTQEDAPELRSDRHVLVALQNKFFPLIQRYVSKLRGISELFKEVRFKFTIDPIQSFQSYKEFENALTVALRSDQDFPTIHFIEIYSEFRFLKKGPLNTRYLSDKVKIEFNKASIELFSRTDSFLVENYRAHYDTSDIENISDLLLKPILKEVDERLKQNGF